MKKVIFCLFNKIYNSVFAFAKRTGTQEENNDVPDDFEKKK